MMHADGQLPELALGTLAGAERSLVEEHLRSCPRCRAELDAIREAVVAIGFGLAPVAPPPSLKARLLRAAQAPGRYAFVDLVTRVFELTRERAEQLLDSVVDPAAWGPGPLAGVELLHFDPGPGLAGADAGLVRFAPGTPFPRHTHLGREVMIVLEGSYTEEDGTRYGAGSRVDNPAGSSHAFVCDAREGCLAGVVLFEGIDIEGYGPVSVKRPGI